MLGSITCLAVLATQSSTSVPVLEVPSHNDEHIVLQAWVNGYDMSAEEASAWRVLGPAMLAGCTGYTPDQVRRFTTLAGKPMSVDIFDDTMRFEVLLPREGWESAARVFLTILTQAWLRDEDVEAQIKSASYRSKEPWAIALEPWNLMVDQLKPSDIKFMYEKVIRPENLSFVAYGPIEAGVMSKFVQGELGRWRVPPKPATPRNLTKKEALLRSGTGLTSIELRCDPVTPSTPFNSARVLATYALGVGKDTTLFRKVREERALAYDVDGVLWPTRKGWEPRFFVLKTSAENDFEIPNALKNLILEDIDTWNEQTLLRARSMAQSSLKRSNPVSGFWVSRNHALQLTQSERAAWRGYMQLVGSPAISPAAWADMLDVVNLETLKNQAKQMIEGSNVYMISGI
ncbi:insulinase family protein [Kamptonema cortianum]|nr:insulinase family protein [Geitlerinema splendidum]MDK3156027.1 insulinase family protein [Kamptonema cortianum]